MEPENPLPCSQEPTNCLHLSQIHPVVAVKFSSFEVYFNIIAHQRLLLATDFPVGFPTKILYVFLLFPILWVIMTLSRMIRIK
jgi:hypothetical protein